MGNSESVELTLGSRRKLGLPRLQLGLYVLVAGLLGLVIPDHGLVVLLWMLLVAGGALLIAHPALGVLLIAATLPVESVIEVGDQMTLSRALGLAVFGAWFVRKLVRRESWESILSSNVFLAAIVLLGLGLASTQWSLHRSFALAGLFQLFQMILWFALVVDLVNSWERVAWLVKVVVIAGLLAAGLTLGQYFFGGAERAGANIAGGINKTSALLVTIVPLAFCLMRLQGDSLSRSMGLLYLVLSPIAVLLTFSRQSFLLMPLAFLSQFWETIKTRSGTAFLVVLFGLVLASTLMLLRMDEVTARLEKRLSTIGPYIESLITGERVVFHARKYSVSARGLHWRVGWEIFQDHPLLGAGYNNYRPLFINYQFRVPGFNVLIDHARSPHSSYVGFLANLGLIGLALWVALLALVVRNATVAWSYLSKAGVSMQFVLVQGLTYAVLLQVAYGFAHNIDMQKLFWLLAAMSVVVRRLAEQHNPSSQTQQTAIIGQVFANS